MNSEITAPDAFDAAAVASLLVGMCRYPAAEEPTNVGYLHFSDEEARMDYRDLIMAAEYDNDNRIRDFNHPFRAEHFHTTNRNT